MNSLVVGAFAFVCMFAGAMVAMLVARYLPERHVSKETQDAVKLGVGMIAAMASLILGLMTASVKGAFDTTDRDVHRYATYILGLDSSLRHYGPDADMARRLLEDYSRSVTTEIWGGGAGVVPPQAGQPSEAYLGNLDTALHRLQPENEDQRVLRNEAIGRFNEIVTTRWSVLEESITPIPRVFIFVLVTWLMLIFASFGLFAPCNAITVGALFLCSLSIAGALFLIIEMSGPFDGVIAISPKAMADVITHVQRPIAPVAGAASPAR